MKYLDFTFTLSPSNGAFQDVLEAELATVGFDSFTKDEEGEAPLKAYVQEGLWNEAALQELLDNFPLPTSISYTYVAAEDKNWNEEWEQHSFQPLVIDDRCVVASPSHKDVPLGRYNILLSPRMSFGTGHHETTYLMLNALLERPMEGLEVLDMGCGTSILAIMARMRGAQHVVAIDIDEWSVENSKENVALNGLKGIDVYHGDAQRLEEMGMFDFILANIHINIILRDLPIYAAHLMKGGLLYVSGFYMEDVAKLKAVVDAYELDIEEVNARQGWCCVGLRKRF